MSRELVITRMHQRMEEKRAVDAEYELLAAAGRRAAPVAKAGGKLTLLVGVVFTLFLAVGTIGTISAHAQGMRTIAGHAAPHVVMPPCTCPAPHAPYVNTGRVVNGHPVAITTSGSGHRELRIWEFIPARHTKGGHFYPGRWECFHHRNGTVTMKWKPAHYSKPTFVPAHWGWVYVRA